MNGAGELSDWSIISTTYPPESTPQADPSSVLLRVESGNTLSSTSDEDDHNEETPALQQPREKQNGDNKLRLIGTTVLCSFFAFLAIDYLWRTISMVQAPLQAKGTIFWQPREPDMHRHIFSRSYKGMYYVDFDHRIAIPVDSGSGHNWRQQLRAEFLVKWYTARASVANNTRTRALGLQKATRTILHRFLPNGAQFTGYRKFADIQAKRVMGRTQALYHHVKNMFTIWYPSSTKPNYFSKHIFSKHVDSLSKRSLLFWNKIVRCYRAV